MTIYSDSADSLDCMEDGLAIRDKFGFAYLPGLYSDTLKGTRYFTTPGVEILSRPQVSREALADFLRSFSDELNFHSYVAEERKGFDFTKQNAGGHLAMIAGQLCYLSFGEKRSKLDDMPKYLTHIKESGHGCYDEETEVLTQYGWRRWPEVIMSTKLATRGLGGRIEYHAPIRLIAYPYEGRMYRVASSQVDLLVTPDHKMLACPTTTKEGRKKQSFRLIPADQLNQTAHAYIKTGQWEDGGDPLPMPIIKLLGFAIGDGNLSKTTLQFRLHRPRKIAWLQKVAQECNFPLTQADGDRFYITLPCELLSLFSIYTIDREKQIPPSFLTSWDKEQLQALFDGLMTADGCRTPTGDLYDTTSARLAGQFQQLCLHIGLSANISQAPCYRDREHSYGDRPLYRLHVVRRASKPEVNKFAGADGKTEWVENWKGMVYCAEVPNNTLYVRRGGKPVWSGNSVLEHANYSLLCYGINRSQTHEIVRHRSGFSYSQVSQRYVDGTKLRFVERPEYQTDGRLHALFLDRIDATAAEYACIAERLLENQQGDAAGLLTAESRTEARKKVNQAARSVLTNEVEAPIIITANIRGWRHFLEQRCSKWAEVEVRALTYRVYCCLRCVEPILFSDYEVVTLPDGTRALETPTRKV